MNKTIFISGVNGGIGNALAKGFKNEGWQIIGVDISGESNSFCDLFFNEDISDPKAIKNMYNEINKNYDSLDCLINNAAIQIEKKLIDTSESEWDKTLRTNLNPIFLTAKYFINILKNASIINISSVHAKATSKGLAAYVASKGAIVSLTRAMALELAEKKIRVNSILPGAIDTKMLRKGFAKRGSIKKNMDFLLAATPLKKIGLPEDIFHLALFLADNKRAGNISGQEFICDGGALARLSTEN